MSLGAQQGPNGLEPQCIGPGCNRSDVTGRQRLAQREPESTEDGHSFLCLSAVPHAHTPGPGPGRGAGGGRACVYGKNTRLTAKPVQLPTTTGVFLIALPYSSVSRPTCARPPASARAPAGGSTAARRPGGQGGAAEHGEGCQRMR